MYTKEQKNDILNDLWQDFLVRADEATKGYTIEEKGDFWRDVIFFAEEEVEIIEISIELDERFDNLSL
jgi:hypothetical protein